MTFPFNKVYCKTIIDLLIYGFMDLLIYTSCNDWLGSCCLDLFAVNIVELFENTTAFFNQCISAYEQVINEMNVPTREQQPPYLPKYVMSDGHDTRPLKSHGFVVRLAIFSYISRSHGTPRKSHDFWKTSCFSKKTSRFSLKYAQKLIVVQESSHSLKQIQPQRTSKSRSARGLSPKNPYLENRCQIRLSLATSLSHSESRPRT